MSVIEILRQLRSDQSFLWLLAIATNIKDARRALRELDHSLSSLGSYDGID
jgi:hypothetical protein